MGRINPNAMTIDEYRKIKEALKSTPINKKTAEQFGRGTTTLATIKKSKSFKNYKELRRKNRGGKKKVREVNAEPVQIPVGKQGRKKQIHVKTEPPLLPEGSEVVVPAALFEALADQLTEVHAELIKNNRLLEQYAAPQFITTGVKGEPEEPVLPTFKEQFYAKVNEIKRRWSKK